MPILPIAMMDTDRMIPSTMHGNGSSPGSNQSGGQLSNGQLTNGLYNGQHHYQNASPTTPIGHPHPGKTSSLHIWMHCFIWTDARYIINKQSYDSHGNTNNIK